MEDPKFKYRLYATQRVHCGQEVAEFINRHSGGVLHVEYVGERKVVWNGKPPYSIESLKIDAPTDHKTTSDLKLILEDNVETIGPILLDRYFSAVSRRGLKIGLVEGPDVPIFSYLVLAAIGLLEYEPVIPRKIIHETLNQLPNSWAKGISSGVLLWPLPDSLLIKRDTDPAVDEHITAIERVLTVISVENPNIRARSTRMPDPIQQTPDEKVVKSGEPEPQGEESSSDLDPTMRWVEQIGVWLENRGMEVGSEIWEYLRDIVRNSDPKDAARVANALTTGQIGADTDLITFLAECPRQSANDLLAEIANLDSPSDDGLLASIAQEAFERHRVTPEPTPPESDEETDTPQPETATTGFFGIDSDTEAPEDALDYRGYAKALASVISDKDTETPFTIGICAPWGRGKSSLMRFIEEEVGKLSRLKRDTKEPISEFHKPSLCVRFDAWKYSKADHVWAGFMDVVLKEVEKSLNRWQKVKLAFSLNRSRDLPLVRNITIFALIFISLVVSAILSPIFLFGNSLEDRAVYWLWSLPALMILTGFSYRKFLAGTWKLLNHPLTERIISLTSLPDYAQRLDPVHRIVSDIRVVLNEFQAWTGIDRFVVMIDDIDRCEPSKIMEVLEAIKHFLNLKGFVFVIAMDSRVVRLAIGDHYKFMSPSYQEWEEMGRFYLEKMIQIPFHLPELSDKQRLKLNEKIITRHLKEIVVTPEPAVAAASTGGLTVEIKSESGDVIERRTSGRDEAHTPSNGETKSREAEAQGKTQAKPASETDTSLRSRITTPEHEVIKTILRLDSYDISPRLWKRFINIYLIARHVLILEHRKKTGSSEGFVPGDSFIKWLAASVRYPWGARALIRWLEINNWANPIAKTPSGTGKVFANDGLFCFRWDSEDAAKTGWTTASQEPFDDLWTPDMHEFGQLLHDLDIDWKEVEETLHISNCFNLVLD